MTGDGDGIGFGFGFGFGFGSAISGACAARLGGIYGLGRGGGWDLTAVVCCDLLLLRRYVMLCLCYMLQVMGYGLWIRSVRRYQAGDEVCMWDMERRRRRRRREWVGAQAGAYHRACVSPCVGR